MGGGARSLYCGFLAHRPTGRLNAWWAREASSLAKASLASACPMIRRQIKWSCQRVNDQVGVGMPSELTQSIVEA